MTHFRHEHQGGFIATFIIVAVLLVGLFALGIYALKQRGTQVAKEKTESSQQTGTNNGTPSTLPGDTSSPSSNGSSGSSSSQGTPDSSRSGSSAGRQPTGTNNLPATGPAETMGSVVVLGLVAFAAGTYSVSRRRLGYARQIF